MVDNYNVKLGPVVGNIINDSVRILLECDNTIPTVLILILYSETKSMCIDYEIACGPNIITVPLLEPKSKHKIIFENAYIGENQSNCSFDPIMKSVAIISCDGDGVYHYNTGNKKKAWNMASNIGATHAVHIGDQVYIDDAYQIGMKRITKETTDEDTKQIFDNEIRKIYYDSWFKCDEKRMFLANHSNIMLVDDHDIYDNFTSVDFIANVLTMDRMNLFIDVASKIAGEYQISLAQNCQITNCLQLYNISKVLFLENERTRFIIVNSRLTKNQKCMFDIETKQIIVNNMSGNKNKKLVFIDQVSPFIVSHQYTQFPTIYKALGFDIKDHITYNSYWVNDYNWLFSVLCWSDACKIVYVTGDLHCGQEHDLVRDRDNKRIKCFTSSPISSNYGAQNIFLGCVISNFSQQYKGFSYKNNLIHANNFVVVTDNDEQMCIVGM